ncbi:MAG: TIGR03118 family protein, partial [Xanthobacteraceae bacterium]|nr:TIGR03118 family protein [Xanthobacteraceae bacterium]
FTPYNIQDVGGSLYVTYAAATSTGAPLPGGFVDRFDTAGNFLERIATNGPINAPWGLAIAPNSFGAFGGDLLVGNLYDSKVNAYNLMTDHLDGSFTVNTGVASSVGLWALDFGNGTTGLADTLYFTSGINDQKDGLFGSITSVTSVPEPSTWAMMLLGFAGLGFAFRQSRRKVSFA